MTAEAFVYDAVRTPRGEGEKTGALHSVKPISLTTRLIEEVRRRNPGLDPPAILLARAVPAGSLRASLAGTVAS